MIVAVDIRYRVRSGASSYIYGLLPALFASAGGEAEFIVIKYDDQETPSCARAKRTIESPARNAFADLWWVNTKLPRLLVEHGADLYHSMKLFGPVNCPVPMIHTAQSITRQCQGEFPLTLQQRLFYGVYGSSRYRKSAAVIAVSQYVADFLRDDLRMRDDQIEVVYNGVNNRFRKELQAQQGGDCDTGTSSSPSQARLQELPAGAPVVLCIGNMEPVKNHITALQAFAKVADDVPHHFVIAGRTDKPCAREAERFIADAGLSRRVHLPGFVELPQLVALLKRADLFVHPSLSEGFGLAVVEAMTCGVPAICSDIPALREAAGDAAMFVADPLDVEGLADSMRRVLTDRRLAESMAAAGVQHAERFTWQRAATRTLERYRRHLPERRPQPSLAPVQS